LVFGDGSSVKREKTRIHHEGREAHEVKSYSPQRPQSMQSFDFGKIDFITKSKRSKCTKA
jgi:hypothetical protein